MTRESRRQTSRAFITFLGMGGYEPVRYIFDGEPAGQETRFVQTAIIRHLSDHLGWRFDDGDRCIVLLTDDARQKNWPGLVKALAESAQGLEPRTIDIPLGRNKDELWRIFQVVVDEVGEGERLVMDITHSYRSLPFMAGAVVDYLRAVKGVECEAIYYGAYDRGRPEAPVIDLRPFIELERWTGAIGDFRRHGDFTRLRNLSDAAIRPLLRESGGTHENARLINKAIAKMDELMESVRYCRGKFIYGDSGRVAREALETLDGFRDDSVAPLHPMFDRFKNILEGFSAHDPVISALHAADLCLHFGLIQQGLTILEETITTWVLRQAGVRGQEVYSRRQRVRAGIAFHVAEKGIAGDPSQWTDEALKDKDGIDPILHSGVLTDELVKLIRNVKQARNDINHFGMKDPMSVATLREALSRHLDLFRAIVTRSGKETG